MFFTGSLAAARNADPSYKTTAGDMVDIGLSVLGFGTGKLLSKLAGNNGGLTGLSKLLVTGNKDFASALVSMLSDPNTAEVAVDHAALLNLEEKGMGKFFQDVEGKKMTDEFVFSEGYIDDVKSSITKEHGGGLSEKQMDQKVSEYLSKVIDAEKNNVRQELIKLTDEGK